MNKVPEVLFTVGLTDATHETRIPTETEAKVNYGVTADECEKINDGDIDVFQLSVANGAIQVRRVLVSENEDEDTVDDMPFVVSDLGLV